MLLLGGMKEARREVKNRPGTEKRKRKAWVSFEQAEE